MWKCPVEHSLKMYTKSGPEIVSSLFYIIVFTFSNYTLMPKTVRGPNNPLYRSCITRHCRQSCVQLSSYAAPHTHCETNADKFRAEPTLQLWFWMLYLPVVHPARMHHLGHWLQMLADHWMVQWLRMPALAVWLPEQQKLCHHQYRSDILSGRLRTLRHSWVRFSLRLGCCSFTPTAMCGLCTAMTWSSSPPVSGVSMTSMETGEWRMVC